MCYFPQNLPLKLAFLKKDAWLMLSKGYYEYFFLFSSLGKNVFRFTFPIKRVLIWVIVWQNVQEISKSNIHQSFATFMIKKYIYIYLLQKRSSRLKFDISPVLSRRVTVF